MRKITLFFTVFLMFNSLSYAILAPTKDDYKNFKKSLRLSFFQEMRINKIESKSDEELNEIYNKIRNLQSDSLIFKMQCAQYKKDCQSEILKTQKTIYNLYKRTNEIRNKKDKDIIAILNKKQRVKYKEFYSRIY